MERLKNYYQSNGLYYLARKIKLKIRPIKKLQSIDIYKTYISNNFLFSKNSTNFPINNSLLDNYWTELTHRKLTLFNFYNIPRKIILRITIKAQEFEVVENLIKEKDMEIFSKNLTHFIKYHHYIERKMINKSSNYKLNIYIMKNAENIDLACLIMFFNSYLININSHEKLIQIIVNKLEAIQHKNKSNYNNNNLYQFSGHLNSNIKDNALLFAIINIINVGYNNSIFWEVFSSIIYNRVEHLQLPEIISICIFILENRYQNENLLNFLSNKIAYICSLRHISLDNNGYQITFNNLNIMKILLDLNRLSFDSNTEITLDELFFKFIEDEVKLLEDEIYQIENNTYNYNNSNYESLKNNSNINNNDNNNNNNINSNRNKFIMDLNKLKIKLIENNFFSNLSYVISKKNHKALDMEEIIKLMDNKIHDLNYFKKLFAKKNPSNVLIILKILAKDFSLLKEIQLENLKTITDLTIDTIIFMNNNFSKKISFLVNMSIIRDCFLILKNLNFEQKKVFLKLIKICFRSSIVDYMEIKGDIYSYLEQKKSNSDFGSDSDLNKKEFDVSAEEEFEVSELKNTFLVASIQIFEFFYYDKMNKDYIKYIDMVKNDIKFFREKELFTKKDLKKFLQFVKNYSSNVEDFKEKCLI
jgi:hypothetical protein